MKESVIEDRSNHTNCDVHFKIPSRNGLPLFSKILEANASGEISNFVLKEWIRNELYRKEGKITLFHATEEDLIPSK